MNKCVYVNVYGHMCMCTVGGLVGQCVQNDIRGVEERGRNKEKKREEKGRKRRKRVNKKGRKGRRFGVMYLKYGQRTRICLYWQYARTSTAAVRTRAATVRTGKVTVQYRTYRLGYRTYWHGYCSCGHYN